MTVLADTLTFNPVISFDFWLQGHISPFSLNIGVGQGANLYLNSFSKLFLDY